MQETQQPVSSTPVAGGAEVAADVQAIAGFNQLSQSQSVGGPYGSDHPAVAKARLVLQGLRDQGFRRFATRDSIQQETQSAEASSARLLNIHLQPEQQAWVDLLLSRRAECIIGNLS